MTKTLFIVMFFLLPLTSSAGLIETDTGWFIEKDFVLPSGIIYRALELIQLKVPLSIEDHILWWSEKRGIDGGLVLKIAECESKLNPKAYNPRDTDGHPKYSLFQFYKPTFYGAGGKDIWNWEEQIEIATKLMSEGLWRKWPTCYKLALM